MANPQPSASPHVTFGDKTPAEKAAASEALVASQETLEDRVGFDPWRFAQDHVAFLDLVEAEFGHLPEDHLAADTQGGD